MPTSRRAFIARSLAGTAALASLAARPAHAQDVYPSKPIRLVVPFVPGGVTDSSGRLIADFLGRRLGQQVVVDNKPGASGNIGTAQVVSAAPDGYTLLLAFDGTMVINPHVFAKVPFDTMADFAPVGRIGSAALILAAHPDLPAKTLKELITLSKTGKPLAYGTSGIGGTPHIAGEMLAQRTGARLEHVPYKGGGQAMTDAMGGAIPLVYTAVAGAHGHVKSGKLKAIAVPSAHRVASLPDVPTFIESGVPELKDYVVESWVGLMAPAKTPAPVLAKLNTELNAVLNDATVRERLAVLGIEPTPGTPEAFLQQMQHDLAAYGLIVKSAGIKVD
jgi:tripartite-type tricarboxylate transporter receptor subunit TctC